MTQLFEELFTAYDLEMKSRIDPIYNGLINATWRIENLKGSYILQKVNHQAFKKPQAIGFNIRLIADYLLKHQSEYLLY